LKKDSLWEYVKRSITPLGQGEIRRDPRLEPYLPLESIDLHGDTIASAHTRTLGMVEEKRKAGVASFVVVTGKSGAICREFPHWMERANGVRSIEILNGGGAYRVTLKRR
jgi:DNA-nicking Smr family endonuclease